VKRRRNNIGNRGKKGELIRYVGIAEKWKTKAADMPVNPEKKPADLAPVD